MLSCESFVKVFQSLSLCSYMYCTVGDYLVMHLSELVRTSFIAATASVDQLKLAGYQALQVLTERGRERERGRQCVSVCLCLCMFFT